MKVIAAMNMTLDGFCDHTSGVVTDELHEHYTDLLGNAGVALYGRITYELMEYWPTVLKNPQGNKSNYDFAVAIDRIPKVVFSHTLKKPGVAVSQTGHQEPPRRGCSPQTTNYQRHLCVQPKPDCTTYTNQHD